MTKKRKKTPRNHRATMRYALTKHVSLPQGTINTYLGMTKVQLLEMISRKTKANKDLGARLNEESFKHKEELTAALNVATDMGDRHDRIRLENDNLIGQLRTMNRVGRVLRSTLARTSRPDIVEHFSSALFDVLRDEDDQRQRNMPAVSDLMRGE